MGAPGFNIGVSIPSMPIPGQTFRNIPKPNFQPAIYALAIREPSPSFVLVEGFTFPISPRNIRKEYTAMTTFYDVAGDPSQQGIQRIVDQYGNAPVIYTISGTTGWQFHGTDGYLGGGTTQMLALQQLLADYATLNAEQISAGLTDLYVLEFYDYFTGSFWEVVPQGRQGVYQDANNPLLMNYQFRFVGVRDLSNPLIPEIADALALAFDLTQAQAAQDLNLNLVQMATFYSGATYVLAG